MAQELLLHVVMYHYIRDLPRTAFPQIKGMMLDDFLTQIDNLRECHEMATVESSLAFLSGKYSPSRNLCLLTFDDGFKEHFSTVMPLLAERRIQGVFFLTTSCLEEKRVLPVHMNHFLVAKLGFTVYRAAFLKRLSAVPSQANYTDVDPQIAQATYYWDPLPVAQFKYLFNFLLPHRLRDLIVTALFEEYLGAESEFAEELYVTWQEAREMQRNGMAVGGHTHCHRPIAMMSPSEMEDDLSQCRASMDANLDPQDLWPFSYPYGKSDSFTEEAIQKLRDLGFDCSFTTEPSFNLPGTDMYRIYRVDCKHVL